MSKTNKFMDLLNRWGLIASTITVLSGVIGGSTMFAYKIEEIKKKQDEHEKAIKAIDLKDVTKSLEFIKTNIESQNQLILRLDEKLDATNKRIDKTYDLIYKSIK